MEASTSPMSISNRTGRIVWANQAACLLAGYARDELIGHTPRQLSSDRQNPKFFQTLWQTLLSGQTWQGELEGRNRDGAYYKVTQIITPIRDDDGAISHFITVQHDFTAQHMEHAEIRRLAYHDGLTGLPNRALFTEQVRQAILHAGGHGKLLALMFIDLDRFKRVNDTLGHACGDQLLIAVAGRLARAVRKSDSVARLGGDEFAILIGDLDHASVVEALARQLIASIERRFRIGEHRITARVSIGISFYPRDGKTFEELLNRADSEMYHAKTSGGGEYRSGTSAS